LTEILIGFGPLRRFYDKDADFDEGWRGGGAGRNIPVRRSSRINPMGCVAE